MKTDVGLSECFVNAFLLISVWDKAAILAFKINLLECQVAFDFNIK